MTNLELLKIEKFANGLTECFQNRQKDHLGKEDTLDKMLVATLNYALSTIDIHLNLARLEFERDANKEASYHLEDR